MIVANSLIVYAFVAGSVEGSTENPTAALAVGLALVPVVFLVLAFLSRHPRAPNAVLYAMMLSLMIGVPLAAFDVVAALTLGFGAGGVVALARLEDDSWVVRSIAVVFVASTSSSCFAIRSRQRCSVRLSFRSLPSAQPMRSWSDMPNASAGW